MMSRITNNNFIKLSSFYLEDQLHHALQFDLLGLVARLDLVDQKVLMVQEHLSNLVGQVHQENLADQMVLEVPVHRLPQGIQVLQVDLVVQPDLE